MNLLLVFLIGFINTTLAKAPYTIDILEIDWNVTTSENCEMDWRITRPSRGSFAVTGYVDFKRDIDTDNSKALLQVYYSSNGISYILTPFHIPMTVFTDGINFLYKVYMMDGMKKCCKNAIDFEGVFKSPITKRRIECENCMIDNENLPDHLRMGYYKMIGVSYGDLAFAMRVIAKFEKE